jgi:hypothetical protein
LEAQERHDKIHDDPEGFIDELEYRIQDLEEALRDCMEYVDVDNLTMQTKWREWEKVLEGK